MAALLTIGWTGCGDRAGGKRRWDAVTTLAAALMITAQAAAGVLEQARVDNEPSQAEGSSSRGGGSVVPGRETVIGAYSGAPYNYPSAARIEQPGATDFTIDPVNWYTHPFKSPIYYGARVAHWFSGGKAGTMVDFIHSKAIAPLEEETDFSGTHRRQAAAAARAHRRRREQARVLARPQHAVVQRPRAAAGHWRRASALCRRRRRRARCRTPSSSWPTAASRALTNTTTPARPAQALLGRRDPPRARVVLRRVQIHLCATTARRCPQMDGSWLPLDIWRQVQALVRRRAAARRPHRDGARQPSGRERSGRALGSRP